MSAGGNSVSDYLERLFRYADPDKSNRLTKEEFSTVMVDSLLKLTEEDVEKLVELCGKNQFDKAAVVVDAMMKDGYPALQILTQLAEAVTVSKTCADGIKARVALRVAEADKALTDGADESLQLNAVVSVACLALGGKK